MSTGSARTGWRRYADKYVYIRAYVTLHSVRVCTCTRGASISSDVHHTRVVVVQKHGIQRAGISMTTLHLRALIRTQSRVADRHFTQKCFRPSSERMPEEARGP